MAQPPVIIKEMEFPKYDGVPDSIDGVSFDEIYELFAGSSYGKILRQRVRYGPYKPEEVSNEEWVRILGPDVNNLEHLKKTLAVAGEFIHLARHPHPEWPFGEVEFSREGEELLCLTAVIHDWGEAVVGDILWHRKTSESDARKEFAALHKIIEELCRPRYEGLLMEKIYLAADIAFLKGDSTLNQDFNVIEKIGYGSTAMRAWEKRLDSGEPLSLALQGIAAKLIEDHLSDWQEKAEIYPASHYFLLKNQKPIQEIIEARIDWRSIPGFDA